MHFATLTRSKQDCAVIDQCFKADGVDCHHFDCYQALLPALLGLSYTLLLVDSALFDAVEAGLLSWLAAHPALRPKLIVFGHFSDRDSMLRAFKAGVSDLLVGALEPNEMYSRVKRAIRARPVAAEPLALAVGPYRLDRETRRLTVRDTPVELSEREFTLAWLFFSAPGTFVSKGTLATLLSQPGQACSARTVEQHVYQLRKKLDLGRDAAMRLRTVYSLGYKLEGAAGT